MIYERELFPPTVSSTFAPWDVVICGLVGLDGGSLLRVERTIYGSFFLLLKNIHNKNHRKLNTRNDFEQKHKLSHSVCQFVYPRFW